MPLSRFRLHLTAWFGAAFVVGLLVLDAGFYVYSLRKADARITRDLGVAARGLREAIRDEEAGHPGNERGAVEDAVGEWPPGPVAFVVWNAAGDVLASRGAEPLRRSVSSPAGLPGGLTFRRVLVDGSGDARVAVYRDSEPATLSVAAVLSTAPMREEEEILAGWLLISLPLVALLALASGYMLTRRALTPVRELSDRAAAINPDALHQRLPVRTPPDEIDGLAQQFNQLLERLEQSQSTNRTFLARAAHQLKTPLTVVRGESALGLERPREVNEHEAILRRIQLSAEQMSRRVAELILLARATAGDRPPLSDDVELDGLVWQCADLMRARAQATRHHLELGEVDPLMVRGNEDLLREACLELVENACKHTPPDTLIRLSVSAEAGTAFLAVTSQGPPIPEARLSAGPGVGGGLGLTIVEWIAGVHGGSLTVVGGDNENAFVIQLPDVTGPASPEVSIESAEDGPDPNRGAR
jgi:two-component system heavy metal sensor histidine kinase CusS